MKCHTWAKDWNIDQFLCCQWHILWDVTNSFRCFRASLWYLKSCSKSKGETKVHRDLSSVCKIEKKTQKLHPTEFICRIQLTAVLGFLVLLPLTVSMCILSYILDSTGSSRWWAQTSGTTLSWQVLVYQLKIIQVKSYNNQVRRS